MSGHNATNIPATQTWTFPLTAEIVAPVAVDAGLVIDRSGSMADPLGSQVKLEAAIAGGQLFAALLRADFDDRINVVRFNDRADVIQAMVRVSNAGAVSHGQIVSDIASEVPPAQGGTAVAAGVMTSLRELATQRPGGDPALLRRAVVVLTDGMDNLAFEEPPGSGHWYSVTGGVVNRPGGGEVDTLPMPTPTGVKVYAIGLGTAADVDAGRLDQIAQATAGYFEVVSDLSGPTWNVQHHPEHDRARCPRQESNLRHTV